ncbi:hypothetical protein L0156_02225 [bacterium]|nr:hypothetical protein [bacterium]
MIFREDLHGAFLFRIPDYETQELCQLNATAPDSVEIHLNGPKVEDFLGRGRKISTPTLIFDMRYLWNDIHNVDVISP